MTRPRADLIDAKASVRVVLGALWTSLLFVFAYVDIFAFFRADIVRGVLVGKVSGPGFEINQRYLLLTTAYIVLPSLMIAATMLFTASVARMLNIVISWLYLVSIIISVVGEHWAYYLLGSAVESVLLVTIAFVARDWPRRTTPPPSDDAHNQIARQVAP